MIKTNNEVKTKGEGHTYRWITFEGANFRPAPADIADSIGVMLSSAKIEVETKQDSCLNKTTTTVEKITKHTVSFYLPETFRGETKYRFVTLAVYDADPSVYNISHDNKNWYTIPENSCLTSRVEVPKIAPIFKEGDEIEVAGRKFTVINSNWSNSAGQKFLEEVA